VQVAVVVVEAEEQAADADAVLRQSVAAHDAIGARAVLHLHPAALARQVRLIRELRDDAVLADAGFVGEPRLGHPEVVRPRRDQQVGPGRDRVQVLGRRLGADRLGQDREALAALVQG
jgi:hypothetical protein